MLSVDGRHGYPTPSGRKYPVGKFCWEIPLKRPLIVAVMLPLLSLAVGGLMALSDDTSDPPEPIGDFVPPSLKTDATYVGRKVCKECHQENFDAHSAHGHASTFAFVSQTAIDHFAGETVDGGKGFGKYTYEADGDQLFARREGQDQRFPLQYSLGSGHAGKTLLTLVPQPQGGTFAIEHRVSWFSDGDRLGLTPGRDNSPPRTQVEAFGKLHQGKVMHKCVYCHVTTGDIVDGKILNLTANVNCEKCPRPRQSACPTSKSLGNAACLFRWAV